MVLNHFDMKRENNNKKKNKNHHLNFPWPSRVDVSILFFRDSPMLRIFSQICTHLVPIIKIHYSQIPQTCNSINCDNEQKSYKLRMTHFSHSVTFFSQCSLSRILFLFFCDNIRILLSPSNVLYDEHSVHR